VPLNTSSKGHGIAVGKTLCVIKERTNGGLDLDEDHFRIRGKLGHKGELSEIDTCGVINIFFP
jgi:hypothetical protein